MKLKATINRQAQYCFKKLLNNFFSGTDFSFDYWNPYVLSLSNAFKWYKDQKTYDFKEQHGNRGL